MKIRSAIHLGETSFHLQLYPVLQETTDHLALKLAAALLFHAQEPVVVTSPQQHPCLMGQDFYPDLLALDVSGQATLWVECGKTTAHKLEKVSKRFRDTRIVMLTEQPREGTQMAQTVKSAGIDRVEIWSFEEGEFGRWKKLISEQNDIIGEATVSSLNLVINSEMFVTELRRIA